MLYRTSNIYLQAGYRRNPFEKLSPEELNRVTDGGPLVQSVLQSGFPVFQIIGGSGFGKSTLLFQIQTHLSESRTPFFYHYCQPFEVFPDLPDRCRWIIIDEAQRLSRADFDKNIALWKNNGTGVILASHMDHEKWLRGTIPFGTVYLSRIFTQNLLIMIDKSLQNAAVGKPKNRFSREAIDSITEHAGGSMEKARALLYEVFLTTPLPETIDRPHIERAAEIMINSCLR